MGISSHLWRIGEKGGGESTSCSLDYLQHLRYYVLVISEFDFGKDPGCYFWAELLREKKVRENILKCKKVSPVPVYTMIQSEKNISCPSIQRKILCHSSLFIALQMTACGPYLCQITYHGQLYHCTRGGRNKQFH